MLPISGHNVMAYWCKVVVAVKQLPAVWTEQTEAALAQIKQCPTECLMVCSDLRKSDCFISHLHQNCTES